MEINKDQDLITNLLGFSTDLFRLYNLTFILFARMVHVESFLYIPYKTSILISELFWGYWEHVTYFF